MCCFERPVHGHGSTKSTLHRNSPRHEKTTEPIHFGSMRNCNDGRRPVCQLHTTVLRLRPRSAYPYSACFFSAGRVFFSHNNSARTVFFSQFQPKFCQPYGATMTTQLWYGGSLCFTFWVHHCTVGSKIHVKRNFAGTKFRKY